MYKNAMDEFLYCPGCDQNYDEAKILPCDIYCSNCVQSLLSKLDDSKPDQFLCKFCDETHFIPKKGFKTYEKFKRLKTFQESLNAVNVENIMKLRIYLIELNANLNDMNERVNNSSDLIKLHCSKLRKKINEEVESSIKKIQIYGDEKLSEVDEYEKDCLVKLSKSTKDFKFLDQMKQLKDELECYVRKFEVIDSDAMEINKSVEELMKNFERKKDTLDLEIFNGALMEFHESQKNLAENLMGSLSLRRNARFTEFKNIPLNDLFPYINLKPRPEFKRLLNKRMLAVFIDQIKNLNLVSMESNFAVVKSYQTPEENVNKFLADVYESRIVVFYDMEFYTFLMVLDENFSLQKKVVCHDDVYSITCDDVNVCLDIGGEINVYDWQLTLLKRVGQSLLNDEAFFISKKSLKKVVLKSGKFFLFYSDCVVVIDEESGRFVERLELLAANDPDEFCFDLDGNFVIVSFKENKIRRYNLVGDFLEEIVTGYNFIAFTYDHNQNLMIFT